MSVNSSRKLSRAIHSQKLFNFTSHIFIYFIFLHFLANKFTFSASILRYRYRSHGQSNCALFYHRRHPTSLPAKALYVKAYSDLFCKRICYRFIVLLRFFFQWHLGFFEKEYTPPYRGFETYYGFWNGKEDYWDHSSQEDVWGTDLRDNMKVNFTKNQFGCRHSTFPSKIKQ